MKKIAFRFLPLIFMACSDSEIITEALVVNSTQLELCTDEEGASTEYVFFKIDENAPTSIALSVSTSIDILQTQPTTPTFDLGTANTFIFRRLDARPTSDYYCQNVPPSSPRTNEEFRAIGGTVSIASTLIEGNDNDGIPADLEVNGDSDGDGIIDALDFDDDGDNVPTIQEGVVVTNGVIDLTRSRDTDRDGILDYLDNDDDNDGIPTIQEDLDGDLDPSNDLVGATPTYLLNSSATAANPAIDEFRENSFTGAFDIVVTIQNLVMTNGSEEIAFTVYELGTRRENGVVVTTTPDFP